MNRSIGREGSRQIGLAGCVASKASGACPARDLYLSPLFEGRRRHVERTCDEWWILSAKYGLVRPDRVIAPYDVTLKRMSREARRAWSACILTAIDRHVRPRSGDVFEIHAGAEYRDFGLVDGLRTRGCLVMNPTEGMSIGRQLQYYRRHLLLSSPKR